MGGRDYCNGIRKDLFVQFVGDARLGARAKPDLVWSTLHNSIKNNIRLFLNRMFLNICDDSKRSTADCAVYFLFQPLQSLCSPCTPTNSHLFFIYLFKFFRHGPRSPYDFLFYSVMSLLLRLHELLHLCIARAI